MKAVTLVDKMDTVKAFAKESSTVDLKAEVIIV